MTQSAKLGMIVILAICGIGGAFAWLLYGIAFSRQPSQDWMVYYTAARAYFAGNLALLGEGQRFTAVINHSFSAYLSHPLPLHPWLYPPPFLLLLLPFGLLPFFPAEALFLILGFAGLVAATRCYAAGRGKRWLFAASLLLCPATAITVGLGQNAFLTSALLVGGFGLAPRRPILAGLLLGALSYKPQLWLMVPVALIAARQWRVLASAAIAIAILALASLFVFGMETWRGWLELMLGPSALYRDWLIAGRLNGQSVYACAALLGATPALANAVQAGATLIAAAAVYWAYRRPLAADLRLAMLLAATILAAPHVIGYDTIMLGIAATLLLLRARRDGFRSGDIILIIAIWLSPLANPPHMVPVGLVTPLLIIAFIACVAGRAMAIRGASASELAVA